MTPAACVLGCSGPVLTPAEQAAFAEIAPWGFILYGRNVESPDQVSALTASLRAAVGRADAPILIDQEGGRVQRLGPPQWPAYPPARAYGDLARADPAAAQAAARLGGRLMAQDLRAVGVDVACAPVLDLASAGAHAVIGDRAFSDDPATVAALGRAVAEGLLEGGVLPVLKHMPGHGRARADSHAERPVVDADRTTLSAADIRPFRALADLPLAMTAHVVFSVIDPDAPATLSAAVIETLIRGEIGFAGLLLSDDVAMGALSGPIEARAGRARAAGCDVVLYGAGDLDGGRAIAAGAGGLDGAAARRAQAALARRTPAPGPFDALAARARFDSLFAGSFAA